MDPFAYIDPPRPGAENMAIDRQLLETVERTGSPRCRVYRWSEPTLSLGHFQAGMDRQNHQPSSQLAMVVRASGGGAIVHHHEWTYAVAIQVGRNKVGAATELYDTIHDALVAGLQALGWNARKWTKSCESALSLVSSSAGSHGAEVPISKEPFLCFQRRSCGDIVVGDYKVVGSAQRRLGASVLQHGSILWRASPYAPELPGLADLPRNPAAGGSTDVEFATLGESLLLWIGQAIVRSGFVTGAGDSSRSVHSGE